jgi:hypothetical protein
MPSTCRRSSAGRARPWPFGVVEADLGRHRSPALPSHPGVTSAETTLKLAALVIPLGPRHPRCLTGPRDRRIAARAPSARLALVRRVRGRHAADRCRPGRVPARTSGLSLRVAQQLIQRPAEYPRRAARRRTVARVTSENGSSKGKNAKPTPGIEPGTSALPWRRSAS